MRKCVQKRTPGMWLDCYLIKRLWDMSKNIANLHWMGQRLDKMKEGCQTSKILQDWTTELLGYKCAPFCKQGKNDPKGDTEITTAAFSISKGAPIASVSVGLRVAARSLGEPSAELSGAFRMPLRLAEPQRGDCCPGGSRRQSPEPIRIILVP